MSPTRSNTMVRPSGETSSDIHVPSVTSYSTSFELARLSDTFHFAGTAALVAGGVEPEGGFGCGWGCGGFWAATVQAARRTSSVGFSISRRSGQGWDPSGKALLYSRGAAHLLAP